MITDTCDKCGKLIPSEGEFCTYCGTKKIKRQVLYIEKILDKIKNEKPSEKLLLNLSNEFRKNWDLIKERQFLTHYFIDIIREARIPSIPNFIVSRGGNNSRTGGLFEDAFGQMLERYLQADYHFWDQNNEFKLNILINNSIPIPNEPRKKRPDIIISEKLSNLPLCIIELKVSYTRRSLIKEYEKLKELYQRLSPDLEFFFIIFNASRQKANTYKTTVNNCRVMCYDFKVDKESSIKQIQPKIIDPISMIFEELKDVIKKNWNL